MKLDVGMLRYLSRDDFRVLVAIELGMKNHELVPGDLIASLSGLPNSAAFRAISNVHKHKLVFHSRQKCDGYRLTYMGYDYLSLRAFVARGIISGIGRRIGVGKESDVYEVTNDEGRSMVLKLHRLGRVSFRAIKEKRDYLGKRKSASWIYMSRLAATREFAYMKALHNRDFPVPEAIDCNRHCIVMSMMAGAPLCGVRELGHPKRVLRTLMKLILRLAEYGLVHGDFNEFNLICDDDENIALIDFPQMISTSHVNAIDQFDRDVNCIRLYFERRFKFVTDDVPQLMVDAEKHFALDVELSASGNNGKDSDDMFHHYLNEVKEGSESEAGSDSDDDDDIAEEALILQDGVAQLELDTEEEELDVNSNAVCTNDPCDDKETPCFKVSGVIAPAQKGFAVIEAASEAGEGGDDAATVEDDVEDEDNAATDDVEEERDAAADKAGTRRSPLDLAAIRESVRARRAKQAEQRSKKVARAARHRKVKDRQVLRKTVQRESSEC